MAALSIVLTGSSVPVAQSSTPMTDAEAHAIYAVLVPPLWAKSGSKGVLLLQRETVKPQQSDRPPGGSFSADDTTFQESGRLIGVMFTLNASGDSALCTLDCIND